MRLLMRKISFSQPQRCRDPATQIGRRDVAIRGCARDEQHQALKIGNRHYETGPSQQVEAFAICD